MKATALLQAVNNKELDARLVELYVDEALLDAQRVRYVEAIEKFIELYGDKDVEIYSAPGRSEVGGNHTDHQHGKVLATALNLDAIAIVAPKESDITVVSGGYNILPVDFTELEIREDEMGKSEGLIRGVCKGIKDANGNVGGFEAYVTSNVLNGAGMSSSAAFEVLIGTILSYLYNDGNIDAVKIAQIAQYAENVYFGKPCGLMDQCACSVGSLINIDFEDPSKPIVKKIDVDFASYAHSLCITDTKGSHADLTDAYAAIPAEMKAVAAVFGKEFLREVCPCEFRANIAKVREACGDRAVIRALHFFQEEDRVDNLVSALEENRFEDFLANIKASGNSSYKYLQNVFANFEDQAVSIGLAFSEDYLVDGKGVSRVHGGGFAGTIQAFVRDDAVAGYKALMDAIFGEGSCQVLKIRSIGGTKVC